VSRMRNECVRNERVTNEGWTCHAFVSVFVSVSIPMCASGCASAYVSHEVATVSRIDKIIGLFCRI